MKTLKDKYKFIKALSFLIIGSFIFLFENVHATNGISNLKISDDGVATWDEYGSNVIYNYVYKSYKGDTTVPYFNIKKYMDLREFDEGTYVFKVKAKNKDNIDLTSYESIKYTYTKTDTYEVSFFSNFGSPIPMQNVLQGQFAKRPQDPTRSGYTFDNWYIDNSCNTLFDFNEPISSDTIVYAKWNRNVDELRIYCDEIPIEKGPLPKFNATSSTQKVNIASYGNDTCWSKNTSMKQDGWFTLGNNPKVDDDTSHYGLRLKVETTDNVMLDDNIKIYFNDVDITSEKLTYLNKQSWGGYIYIDLGSIQPKFLDGDLNNDGYVNSTDASFVLDRFKNNDATNNDYLIGDMNKDNVLNALDAAMILDVFKNS